MRPAPERTLRRTKEFPKVWITGEAPKTIPLQPVLRVNHRREFQFIKDPATIGQEMHVRATAQRDVYERPVLLQHVDHLDPVVSTADCHLVHFDFSCGFRNRLAVAVAILYPAYSSQQCGMLSQICFPENSINDRTRLPYTTASPSKVFGARSREP